MRQKLRITDNVRILREVLISHQLNSDESAWVYDTTSKTVLSDSNCTKVINHTNEGKRFCEQFIEENIKGTTSFWDLLTLIAIKKTFTKTKWSCYFITKW